MEASGSISIYKYEKPRPGLSILPVKDIDAIIVKDQTNSVCTWCGTLVIKNHFKECPNCGHDHWAAPSEEFIKDE